MARPRRFEPDPLLAVQASLTDRDYTLLGWLYDHGVLTTEQIATALFSSLVFCQRRMLRLTELGVVARFRPLKMDGGSNPYHYLLDQLGLDIIAAQRGDDPPRRDAARKRRVKYTERANLRHLLGINGFFTDLAGYARTHPGAQLDTWRPASHYYYAGSFVESDNDNLSLAVAGARLPRPDSFGEFIDNGRTCRFWFEHDEGTEAVGTILTGKVFKYWRLYEYTRRPRLLLLWLPSTRRELNTHHAIDELGKAVPFPIATAASDHVRASGLNPAEKVWWLHTQKGTRYRLTELPTDNPDHDRTE